MHVCMRACVRVHWCTTASVFWRMCALVHVYVVGMLVHVHVHNIDVHALVCA